MAGKKLTTNDVAEMLSISPVTILRWAHQGKIPYKMKDEEIYFVKSELIKWAKTHDIVVKSSDLAVSKINSDQYTLSKAIENGGFYNNVKGTDIYSVLKNSVMELDFIDDKLKELVLDELLEREEYTSTGIGHGIAIPHPRCRLKLDITSAFIPIVMLKNPVEFNSIDNRPVSILFFLFTTTTKEHLKLLAKISHLIQSEKFLMEIGKINNQDNLITLIKDIEQELWNE